MTCSHDVLTEPSWGYDVGGSFLAFYFECQLCSEAFTVKVPWEAATNKANIRSIYRPA